MADPPAPELLRDAIQQMLDDRQTRLGDRIPDEAGRGFDAALWQEIAALGWLGIPIAERHGGLGLGPDCAAVLFAELGRALASVPAIPTLLSATTLAGEAADRWLPGIAVGEVRAAIALWDVDALSVRDGCVFGIIPDVLDADSAHLLVLPTDDGAFALIETDQTGLSLEHHSSYDLTRSVATVRLDGAAGTILPVDPAARDRLIDHAAIAIAADSIGGAEAILVRTIDYMGFRTQFGRPIGSFQALKHRAAHWRVQLDAAAALVRHAAAAMTSDRRDAPWLASAAKALAADTYAAIAEDAIQLHGGIGFTWEHVCHLHLRRAKMNQLLFGSSRDHKDRVARLAFAGDVEEESA